MGKAPTPFGTALKYEKKTLKIVGSNPNDRPDAVDKVTGKARYAADINLPNQLIGKVLRSKHPHARIKSIDTSAAEKLPGVKAVVTRDDFPDMPVLIAASGELMINFRDVTRGMMAREKVLHDGHPVAAVAATSELIAKQALKLIKVEYEVLPHVIDVEEAMRPDAPLLHEDQITKGVTPPPTRPSNLAAVLTSKLGDIEAGFAKADIIIEREFRTKATHQGYIEPQASIANYTDGGVAEVWTATQGHFVMRAQIAKLLGMDVSKVKVTPAELGGGFGGKNNVYLEPLAVKLSQKARRPVKMVMTRDEVFRATGPTSGTHIKIKMGATKEGRLVAGQATLDYQAGCFPGSSLPLCAVTVFTRYDLENVLVVGNDVVCNRPKVAAYRAPGAPMVAFGVETVVDEIAEQLKIDPIEFRLMNAAKEGTQTHFGPKLGPIGYIETLKAAQAHPHWKAPLGPNQGRGLATAFWFTIGMETSATLNINEDGTASLIYGTVDVTGGGRAALSMIVAEELGIPHDRVRAVPSDTTVLGFNFMTAGSRGTAAGSMAAVKCARDAITRMIDVAAKKWNVKPEQVVWEDGHARPAGANVGDFKPLSVADIAREAAWYGGTIAGPRRDQRDRPGAGLRHAHLRRRGRPRDRRGEGAALYDRAGRRQGGVPRFRARPVAWRGGAGHRHGAQRGVHLQRRRPALEPRLPRLSRARRLRPAETRGGDRRGAEPAASLRRARRRRGADHPADRGHRQRDLQRDGCAHARAADVAAARAGRAERGRRRPHPAEDGGGVDGDRQE